MRRLDDVAVGMLRDLLGAIVTGRAQVVSLQAEEDEEHALAVRWVVGAAPVEAPEVAKVPEQCGRCGHAELWATQHGVAICPACGSTVG